MPTIKASKENPVTIGAGKPLPKVLADKIKTPFKLKPAKKKKGKKKTKKWLND